MDKLPKYNCPEGLVKEIAKLIDPGSFAEWHDSNGNLHEPSSRLKYMRTKAENVAADIMEKLSRLAPGQIRKALEKHEREGWAQFGIKGPAAEKAIAEKHRQLQTGELSRPHIGM